MTGRAATTASFCCALARTTCWAASADKSICGKDLKPGGSPACFSVFVVFGSSRLWTACSCCDASALKLKPGGAPLTPESCAGAACPSVVRSAEWNPWANATSEEGIGAFRSFRWRAWSLGELLSCCLASWANDRVGGVALEPSDGRVWGNAGLEKALPLGGLERCSFASWANENSGGFAGMLTGLWRALRGVLANTSVSLSTSFREPPSATLGFMKENLDCCSGPHRSGCETESACCSAKETVDWPSSFPSSIPVFLALVSGGTSILVLSKWLSGRFSAGFSDLDESFSSSYLTMAKRSMQQQRYERKETAQHKTTFRENMAVLVSHCVWCRCDNNKSIKQIKTYLGFSSETLEFSAVLESLKITQQQVN